MQNDLSPQKKEQNEIVREFLRQLDASKTEQERIDKVMALVSGVMQSAINHMEAANDD